MLINRLTYPCPSSALIRAVPISGWLIKAWTYRDGGMVIVVVAEQTRVQICCCGHHILSPFTLPLADGICCVILCLLESVTGGACIYMYYVP